MEGTCFRVYRETCGNTREKVGGRTVEGVGGQVEGEIGGFWSGNGCETAFDPISSDKRTLSWEGLAGESGPFDPS